MLKIICNNVAFKCHKVPKLYMLQYGRKLSQQAARIYGHNVALKCHKLAKLHARMWQKIVTICSQNSLYVTSVIKMWHFCSLFWSVDFLSQIENRTTVLPFTFCDNLISAFIVWAALIVYFNVAGYALGFFVNLANFVFFVYYYYFFFF